jgi:hypothetical protein
MIVMLEAVQFMPAVPGTVESFDAGLCAASGDAPNRSDLLQSGASLQLKPDEDEDDDDEGGGKKQHDDDDDDEDDDEDEEEGTWQCSATFTVSASPRPLHLVE